MAFRPFRLLALTPVKTLIEAAGVAWVQAQLTDGGGIGIYPGHAPLLAETCAGPLRYADAVGEHAFELEAGILHVQDDVVTLFVGASASLEPGAARFDRLAEALRG